MENQYFTPTNPLCIWVQRILPLVYDDSLSYYEVLGKVVEKINILINNNNNIPAYVKQVFNEFVESGQLEILVKQIIDRQDIVVNVKYPPENVTAALGDGATNDTAAFNACIAYAMKNGIPVYIPAGVYMVDAMTINGNVQIFGTSKTDLYLNVKPEAGALFTINGGNVSLLNLTAYGQHAKQPNDTTFLYVNEQNANVEVNSVSVREFNRGFELLDTNSFKAKSCNFVNNGMNAITTSNNAYNVTIDNCHFEGLTERNATTYIISNSDGLRLTNAEFLEGASIGINYVGSENVFIHYYNSKIATPVTGTGENPIIIENNGKIKYALDDDITAYIANLILNTSGDMTLETHDMTVNAERLTETISGEKASQAAKRTDVVSGTASLEAGAIEVQTTQGEKHEVAGQFNVHAGSYKMLDVVRRTASDDINVADEAPFIDNTGNNRAFLIKGATDINAAVKQLSEQTNKNAQDITTLNTTMVSINSFNTFVNSHNVFLNKNDYANITFGNVSDKIVQQIIFTSPIKSNGVICSLSGSLSLDFAVTPSTLDLPTATLYYHTDKNPFDNYTPPVENGLYKIVVASSIMPASPTYFNALDQNEFTFGFNLTGMFVKNFENSEKYTLEFTNFPATNITSIDSALLKISALQMFDVCPVANLT